MRLLHLPHGYWPATGGAEHLSRGWSEGLAARGHDVRVTVADLATPEGLYRFGVTPTGRQDETVGGVQVHRVGLGSSYRIGGALFRSDPYAPGNGGDRLRRNIRQRLERAIRKDVETFSPDVVLTLPHLFENVRIVFTLQQELGFPLVWAPMLHEADPNWPFDEIRSLIGRADALLAMTGFEADRLVTAYGANTDRVHVVSPGVDSPAAPPDMGTGPPTILYLGRVTWDKGLGILPEAMSTVWRHLPSARLVIAGASTPDVPAIRDAFPPADLPGEGSVEFHIDVTETEKQRLLHEATVLTLPSERESFGIVLLEAWATATPVVTVDTPVMRDTVRDGVDGFLFPPGDAVALGETLRVRLEDPESSYAGGIAGFDRTGERYTWSAVTRRLEAALEQAVSSRSKNPA